MEIFFGVLIGLICLVILVAVHELGHAIAAIRSGVVVEEFGIGFPPKAWSKKLKNGILFSLNWLPLGGFVKLQGEYDASDKPGDYGAASYWQKTKILLAGVLINWVVAAILLSVLAVTGLPRILPNQFSVESDTSVTRLPVQIVGVSDGSAADKAGLQAGDKIISLNGSSIATPDDLIEKTKANQSKKVEVEYDRGGATKAVDVKLSDGHDPQKGYLGVATAQQEIMKSTWSAPIVGVATTGQFSWVTLVGVKDLAVNTAKGLVMKISPNQQSREEGGRDLSEAANSVAGPLGILGVIFPAAAKAGLVEIVFLTAIISLTLAVMNILPIPALDGGRWFTMTIFRLLNKPLTKEREELIQGVGFMALMALIVVITLVDIGRLF